MKKGKIFKNNNIHNCTHWFCHQLFISYKPALLEKKCIWHICSKAFSFMKHKNIHLDITTKQSNMSKKVIDYFELDHYIVKSFKNIKLKPISKHRREASFWKIRKLTILGNSFPNIKSYFYILDVLYTDIL